MDGMAYSKFIGDDRLLGQNIIVANRCFSFHHETGSIRFAALCVLLIATPSTFGQPARTERLFARQYHEGDRLAYRMKGLNQADRYEIRATGVVKKDPSGNYIEEYAWSNLINDGVPRSLSSSAAEFRQPLSLDPNHIPSVPNLGQVDRVLIGPITDLLTFYSVCGSFFGRAN
jgi:hypothetical protein